MKGVVGWRQGARQDLVDIFRRYAREAGIGTARRFLAQAEKTFRRLAGMPGIGAHLDLENPALADLRFFPISHYKKYLVFYRPITDGIEIARVLHGARDIQRILVEEFGAVDNGDEDTLEDK